MLEALYITIRGYYDPRLFLVIPQNYGFVCLIFSPFFWLHENRVQRILYNR